MHSPTISYSYNTHIHYSYTLLATKIRVYDLYNICYHFPYSWNAREYPIICIVPSFVFTLTALFLSLLLLISALVQNDRLADTSQTCPILRWNLPIPDFWKCCCTHTALLKRISLSLSLSLSMDNISILVLQRISNKLQFNVNNESDIHAAPTRFRQRRYYNHTWFCHIGITHSFGPLSIF